MSRRQPSSPSSYPAPTSVEVLRRLVAKRQAAGTRACLDLQRLSRAAANRTNLASGTLVNVRQLITEMSRRAEPTHAPEQANTAPHVEAVALLRAIHAEAKSRLATPQDIEKALRAYAIGALIQDLKASGR